MALDSTPAVHVRDAVDSSSMEALVPTGEYVLDPAHTRIGFVARHAMVTKVRGAFHDFTGTGYFDAEDPAASSITLSIRAESLDTGHADRDGHVRSSDFLDVVEHPTITFTSTTVRPLGAFVYRVTGDLTVRGISRSVTIDFEFTGAVDDPDVGLRFGLEGSTVISRKDWGLTWNSPLDAGGVLVGDKVVLEFDVSVVGAT